ncbi:MAG: glutamine--tRNA ligase/YqeY domain fusion protein [Planctomycetota bacterium]
MTSETESAENRTEDRSERRNFVQQRIDADVASGRHGGRVHLRFPPEPNGYPHIGHAKAICTNFGLAKEYGGRCNLRFDDTNPSKEEMEYVEAMREDIRWLGFEWDAEFFASSYFDELYDMAVRLVRKGKAYVCDLPLEEMRRLRGDGSRPGTDSPFRGRSPEENLDLLERMKAGEFANGEKTLRAKIDMASPNMNMRDPIMYRIMHVPHHQTGDRWCIYPTYDWAHGQSDSIEGITHSLCSLEFENHRPLYEWYLEQLDIEDKPQQIEFARLEVAHMMTSKRKLLALVQEGVVSGWDDPRMPTLRGLRRRGYTPSALRDFIHGVGLARFNSTIDIVVLENTLRDELNRTAQRRMAVLRPLEVVIENWPEGRVETIEAVNNPGDESAGTREITMSGRVLIDREDFELDPPKKWFRLAPDKEVRLRYGYAIRCKEVVTDPATGEVTKLVCTYDPESAGGRTSDGRKVKGIVHWVDANAAVRADVRLYDHLLRVAKVEELGDDADWRDAVNPQSLEVVHGAMLEPSLMSAEPGATYQFERVGYFTADTVASKPGAPVFHRTVALKDTWSKIAAKGN